MQMRESLKFAKVKRLDRPENLLRGVPVQFKKTESSDPAQADLLTERVRAPTVWQELLFLLAKIAAVVCVFLLIFTLVFGIFRCQDPDMSPAVNDGDLIIYFRLNKRYMTQDVIVLEYNGKKQVRRVVATAGDVVKIEDGKLIVNGAVQQERNIYYPTQPYEDGVRFPITLNDGEVFVLGDNRTNATDSRVYGVVRIDDSFGKVMAVIRRRGF